MTQYIGLAVAVAHRLRNPHYEWEDWKQEAILAMIQAVPDHVPSKSSMKTYLISEIRWRLLKLFKQKSVKRPPLENPQPDLVELRDAVEFFLSKCNVVEKNILQWRYFEDLSYRQIGERLGINAEAARMWHDTCIAELRKRAEAGSSIAAGQNLENSHL